MKRLNLERRYLGGIWAVFGWFLAAVWPAGALAHTSEGGFVLLLPTGYYVWGGAASVAATVLLILLLPERAARGMFATRRLFALCGGARWSLLTSGVCAVLLAGAVVEGLRGGQDPTHNALPLLVWTAMWLFVVTAQGIVGDLWRWVSPFRAPYALLRACGLRPVLRWPRGLGHWPGVLSYGAFAAVLLVDIAPADPDRLAWMVLGYWVLTLTGCVIFGPVWLVRAEGVGIVMRAYARLAPVARRGGAIQAGLPGWGWVSAPVPGVSLAIFMLITLACGSFDGLNETFAWLGWIGVNPLEFSGRSAVVLPNAVGLGVAVAALVAAYGLAVQAGLLLVGDRRFALGFRMLAPAILPIAFGYHIAHYLTAALVNGQYLADIVSDHIGGPEIEVTTGFLNQRAPVHVLFMVQAGAVVLGHVIAILMSHAAALRLTGSHRRAAISQAPLALFMIAYTLFGLWLLASPRGA
ncbi:hypothetical protein [Pseudooceanicola sediminis]|uniref:hypothetical protein n=1 Tax=Pseudooceanicola sediminis TaxID=2211117 RepID=UPI001313FFDA|nr:hypothetical protein [Pseudooceanicola sediminis]|tara:strand:- start:41083 stop:42480 length:1398 start_codon:yes stop_codon:yes gene_type:complete